MRNITILKLVCFAGIFSGLLSCNKEEDITPVYTYSEPVPAIVDGGTEAQKLCYAFYKQYDLHVYYALGGKDALRTGRGYAQTSTISRNNPEALPMQPGDEVTAERVLKLMKGIFGLLPEQMVRSSLHKRQVLVKVNPGANKYKDEAGNRFYCNTHTEDPQGILYYGDVDDAAGMDLKEWKFSICYEFFRGLATTLYKGIPLPETFRSVSEGMYYSDNLPASGACFKGNTFKADIAKERGFVHPLGNRSNGARNAYPDWGSYVAWVLTTPLVEREADFTDYPRIKEKYRVVLEYYKQHYDLDLEALAVKIQAITVGD